MTNVELDELPEEVLLHVLSYIDHPSRRDVVLVCTKFYSLMCELEKDQFTLDLCWKDVKTCYLLKLNVSYDINRFHSDFRSKHVRLDHQFKKKVPRSHNQPERLPTTLDSGANREDFE